MTEYIDKEVEKEFMKGKSAYQLNDWKREAVQLRKDLKCMERRAITTTKILSGYLLKDAGIEQEGLTEGERVMIENSRQVIVSILGWLK